MVTVLEKQSNNYTQNYLHHTWPSKSLR